MLNEAGSIILMPNFVISMIVPESIPLAFLMLYTRLALPTLGKPTIPTLIDDSTFLLRQNDDRSDIRVDTPMDICREQI